MHWMLNCFSLCLLGPTQQEYARTKELTTQHDGQKEANTYALLVNPTHNLSFMPSLRIPYMYRYKQHNLYKVHPQQAQTRDRSSETARPVRSLPQLLEAHVAVAVLLHHLGHSHLKVLLQGPAANTQETAPSTPKQ